MIKTALPTTGGLDEYLVVLEIIVTDSNRETLNILVS